METPEDLTLLKQLFSCAHSLRMAQKYRGQSRLLILLLERGTMTQRELTEETGRRPATLSEQLGNLEQAGLVLRAPNGSDRRNIDVTLTAAGLETARDAVFQRAELARDVFSGYSRAERETISRFLREIAARLDESAERRGL